MTISTTASRISYNGNGATTAFSFPYRFLTNADLTVIKVAADGTETTLTLNTNYTVTGADQDAGGTVTLSVAPLTGQRVVIYRAVTITQEVDYITGDAFPAETHERALDRLTMIAQQHQDAIDRSAKLSETSTADADTLIANINTLAAIEDDVSAVAAIDDDVSSVAAIDANVTTVAGIAANVTTVAGIAANVTSVAGNATNINTVAGNNSNVTTVAGISAAVTAVAADATDIGTVAADIADVTTCADNISAIIAAPTEASNAAASAVSAANSAAAAATALDSFDDRYLGSKTSDPTLDNDGNALVTGALYYNSTSQVMKVYDGANWIAATAAGTTAMLVYKYVATAGQTTFSGAATVGGTMSYTSGNILVFLNGASLDSTDYTATNGTSVVIGSAAALNDELVVVAFKSFSVADTYTKGEVDAFAVKLTGAQTVAGTKTFSSEISAPNTFGFKNRIINGAMVIDQRNAGASVTANDGYYLDRWKFNSTQNGKGNIQRSTVAPSGFTNSLLFTSTSAYSVLSSDLIDIQCRIEGFNMADLGWGAAGAQTVTLSFWVRSSLTGTFGGSFRSGSGSARSYPFTYVISAANTWEQKTITVAGDTSGTWATDNTQWGSVQFGLGDGSTYSGTAGAWASATYTNATGATSVVGTNGATFYITGVQLEKGSTATSFDYRDYGRELIMCQRYYYKYVGGDSQFVGMGDFYAVSQMDVGIFLPVTMRTTPTLVQATGSAYYSAYSNNAQITVNSWNLFLENPNSVSLYGIPNTNGTAGYAARVKTNNASASLGFSAEL